MASPSRVHAPLSLEEFLWLPEIDEHPYMEYIDGKVEPKVSPQKKHSLIATGLARHLDDDSVPRRLGLSFVELRCTFAGRSMIPDVVFLLREHIAADEQGEAIDETLLPPDIHVESISPDQSAKKAREKLLFSTVHGCPLGWLIDPERKTMEVYRPGSPPHRLAAHDILQGDPILPGYRLAVPEVFGWMRPSILQPPGVGPSSPGSHTP
jgi:Uma2 family endonuclease